MGLAMGKQWGNSILDLSAKRAGIVMASAQTFLAYLEQNFVQARIGVDERSCRRSSWENYFVGIAAKLNLVSKEASELRNIRRTGMHQRHTCWQELPIAEQTKHPDHCNDTKFDLLTVRMARDARIAQT